MGGEVEIKQQVQDRRAHPRYLVNLKAVAVRLRDRLLPNVPTTAQVTIKDISQVALRWHSKEIFYRGELVGLSLRDEEGTLDLKCVVRVFRTRRISGQYEVVGFFLKVARDGSSAGSEKESQQHTAEDPAQKTPAEA